MKTLITNSYQTTEPINTALKDHQTQSNDWEKHELIENLHIWTERFISGFKLKAPQPALRIEPISKSCYGHYRKGRNGFGLRDEVALNERYIDPHRYWRCLQTLLHELLHVEQENYGEPGKGNYHNKQFRNRALEFGLAVDQWGHTHLTPAPNPFTQILDNYGITVPHLNKPAVEQKGKSKLKLWVCKCKPRPVHVRVAIKDFQALCMKCGFLFQKQE
jgi:hypothetical protein